MTKTFVYIGGYAQVGKTSVMNELRGRGYNCFSTSEILYEVAEKLCSKFLIFPFYLFKRDEITISDADWE